MSNDEVHAGPDPAEPTAPQLLEDDLAECSRLLALCAQQASEDGISFDARMIAMSTVAKLMRASASAASILMRAQATTHRIIVDRPLRRRRGPEVEAEINRIAAEYYRRAEAAGDTPEENPKTTSPP